MNTIFRSALIGSLLLGYTFVPTYAQEPERALAQVLPVIDEPLHIVRHSGEHFLIYTNWIEPGVWTQYHGHRNDLLAVIAADATVASQTLNKEPRKQTVPAGTVVFFPYTDSPAPYVHRVGVHSNDPFINIGLEFQDPISATCSSNFPVWNEPRAQALAPNRRGQAYRLTLPAASDVIMPEMGRGLLLVPLGRATLQLDEALWNTTAGDFRFYNRDRPQRLRNTGTTSATLVVFNAC